MKPDTRKIIDEAMKLDPSARAMVAETLLDSLEVGADFEISEAWRKEIRRRCSEIDDGSLELIPGERVLDELWAKYGS
jgi:putative addiction module component (TIGR02574 family)